MNKIKTLKITGIRGIKETLTLTPDKRSYLIYGENGSGKSSISDALEWFYNDKIEHLRGAEIGKEVIKNIFLPEKEDGKIEIRFSENKFDSEKSINSAFKIFNGTSTDEYYSYIKKSQSENLILRYSDLVQFVIATKGEKLTYLQSIIGFDEVREIRGLLYKIAGRFAKEIKSANYNNKKSSQQSILIESLGQNIISENQFFELTTKLVKPLKLEKEIKSFKDARSILKSIETKEETQLVEQINFHNKIADGLAEMDLEIDRIVKAYKEYYSKYSELRKDTDKIKKLQLLDLLTAGLEVLKKDIIKDEVCPLCQQAKSKIQLIQELNERIEDLKELKSEKENLEGQAEENITALQNNINALNSLFKEKLMTDKENSLVNKTIMNFKTSLNEFSEQFKKDIFSKDGIKEITLLTIDKKAVIEIKEQSKNKAKEIQESVKGNIKLIVHTKLARALDAYIAYRKIEKEQELMTNRQTTFEALYADFIKRQEEALNVFLNMFSGDINKYYTLMNPKEEVEDIRLVPMKNKYDDLDGITISYKFYNKKLSPPTALLSESHINCLGLSFFLASVKAFNKENDFFVLDDVISSFDGNHRTRFIRLLTDEFDKYQIILMTHEKDFFEIATSEVKQKNWGITSIFWIPEKGAGFEIPLTDLLAKIENKFKIKDVDGLGNYIRKYSERQLKHIAFNIEANLPFRFNRYNEDRMMNELLTGIQSKINKHSPNDLKTKNNIDNLLASPLLISNRSSHDSEFKENIADLEVFWEDVKKLIKTFYCSNEKCKSFIAMKNYDTAKYQIRCSCGAICYDWKK